MKGPIAVLTNTRDLAADDVIRRLTDAGCDVARINADLVVDTPIPSWTPHSGGTFNPSAVWWRQFELPVPGPPPIPIDDAEDLMVVRAQWRSWLSTLDQDVPWMNPLWAARRAESKPEQLRAAVAVGFAVPETLVSNDPAAVDRFRCLRPSVVKAIAGSYFELSSQAFVYTQDADRVEAPPHSWMRQPVIVQQRVEGAGVRVIAVGGEMFGAFCESTSLDWRTQQTPSPWRDWSIPVHVRSGCRRLLDVFSLEYGAFDFVDDGDQVWFLEVNQAGEWSFIERSIDAGIPTAVANHLSSMSRRGR